MRLLHATLFLSLTLFAGTALALDTGEVAPALKVTTLGGQPFDLAAERGKIVVLNFWATWCNPCRAEMPVLDAFYRKYRDRGVVVFGLSEDDADDEDMVRKAMAAFAFPAALAEAAEPNGFHTPRVLPVTYVIDAQGVVRARLWNGGTPVTAANLEQAVLPLLPAAH